MARDSTKTRRSVSLAKGPVGIVGLIGIFYGLSALIFASHGFALHIPHGAVHGKKWIGLEGNGWTDLLFIAAGLALLLAAPLHWGATSMSLLVGLVVGAAATIAFIRKDGVFGIFAANHLTELVWAAAGVLLMVLALLPRVGAREGDDSADEQSGAIVPRSTAARGLRAPVQGTPRTTVDGGPGLRSRRQIRRRPVSPTSGASGQHARWLANAGPEDRPPSADTQTTDNHKSH